VPVQYPAATIDGDEIIVTHLIDEKQRAAALARLARLEGQLRGVRRMIEENQDCESVVQQMAAVRGALNKAFYHMMACSLSARLLDESDARSLEEKADAMARLLARYA